MGLDMYLNVSRNVYDSSYSPSDSEEYKALQSFINDNMVGSPLKSDREGLGVAGVNMQVAYWRKANAIHSWFVDNCQGGVDECQESHVEVGQLEELISSCSEVLELLNPYYGAGEEEASIPDEMRDSVASILQPTSGFFFGSTEIDAWFYDDVKYTHDRLDEIVKWVKSEQQDKRFWYITYQASW